MARDASIPLVLWISAAVIVHAGGGGGAVEVAQVMQDRADIRALVKAVQHELRPSDRTFEVSMLTEAEMDALLPKPELEPPIDESEADDPDALTVPLDALKSEKAKSKPKKVGVEDLEKLDKELTPEPPAKEKPEEPKVEPPKPEEKKAEEKPPEPVVPLPPVPPPPPPPSDNRLAIRQHVEKDQEDNPDATRIADDANHVAEETVARIRAHDQDDPTPSPGTHVGGPKDEVGNSDHDDVAHSEERQGEPGRAPGEGAKSSTAAEHSHDAPGSETRSNAGQNAKGNTLSPTPGANVVRAGSKEAVAPSPGGAGPASPEVMSAEGGSYSLDPANPGGDGKSKKAGRRAARATVGPVDVAAGTPGVARLSQRTIEAVVGRKQLEAERAADGASRRSAHRGSWEGNKFERWRPAIENYDPTVKLGNQTALNAARVPFAGYINTIHNRLHPIFAEEFLEFLDGMPSDSPLNDADLVTHLEIVLSRDEGKIVRLGVTRASGVTAFDVAALNAVSRGSPYGRAPDAVISTDGNVYLHWEFHRDPFDACTTRHARPYIIKVDTPPPETPAPRRPLLPRSDDGDSGPLLPLRTP